MPRSTEKMGIIEYGVISSQFILYSNEWQFIIEDLFLNLLTALNICGWFLLIAPDLSIM